MKANTNISERVKVLKGIDFVGKAKTEKNLQLKLERYQNQIITGQTALDKAVEAAKRELERISKTRTNILKAGQSPVSSYGTLRKYAKENFAGITRESLASEFLGQAEDEIKRDNSRAIEKLTKDQEKVITQRYGIKAARTYEVISQVNAVLAWEEKQHGAKKVTPEVAAMQVEKNLEEAHA